MAPVVKYFIPKLFFQVNAFSEFFAKDSRLLLLCIFVVSTFAFASAGGGWAGAGTGFGGEKGWGPPKGNRGTKHYSPSLNKYGGGGPLAFVPGKGGGGRQFAPNAGNSGNPGNAGSAGASASAGAGNREVIVPETTVHIVTCDVRDKCHSFVHCASYPFNYLRAQDRCCLMQKLQGRKGICCDARYPENDNGNSAGKPFKSYATDKVRIPDISESSLADAAKKGYEYKEKYNQIEDRLHELNIVVQRGTPEYGHLQFFQVRENKNILTLSFVTTSMCMKKSL